MHICIYRSYIINSWIRSEQVAKLFKDKNFAYLVMLVKDGSPQVTPVWCDFDGTHVRINSARGRVKDRNMRRDPRVTLAIQDPDNPYRYLEVRGRVVEITEAGADAHIDKLAKRFLGADKYPFRRPGEKRVVVRTKVDRIGGYNESLLTNEDYEFNTRIRQAKGRVWLDPSIRSVYFARSTLKELIRQYWRYGFWKWRMLRNFPGTVRWRQALPPLFVLSLVGLLLVSVFFPPAWWLLIAELILYFSVLLLAGMYAAIKQRKFYLLPGLPMAIAAMHLSWGSGFLWSMLTTGKNK